MPVSTFITRRFRYTVKTITSMAKLLLLVNWMFKFLLVALSASVPRARSTQYTRPTDSHQFCVIIPVLIPISELVHVSASDTCSKKFSKE